MKVGYQGSIQLSDETEFQNPTLIEYRVGQPTIVNGMVVGENPNRFTIVSVPSAVVMNPSRHPSEPSLS
jgi:hypothetical protein